MQKLHNIYLLKHTKNQEKKQKQVTTKQDIDRYNVVLDLPSGWSTPSVTGSTYGEDQVNAATIAVKYALYLHKWVALQMFDCLCRDIGETKYIPNRTRQLLQAFKR